MFTLHCGTVHEATPEEFSAWVSRPENRIVRETEYGDARVHTLFLGMNWGTDADPIFFLTHVVGGSRDALELRAANLSTALENHAIALAAMKG